MHELFFNSRLSYILQVIPITVLAGVIYILLSVRQKKVWNGNRLARLLFVCYCTALVNIVLTPSNFWGDIWYSLIYGVNVMGQFEGFRFACNLIPTFVKYLAGTYTGGSWIGFMTLANTLLLIPFGVLFPAAFPEKKTLKAGFITILSIELLQPVVGRSFDVDDLIFNGIGLLIGWLLWLLLRKIMPKT